MGTIVLYGGLVLAGYALLEGLLSGVKQSAQDATTAATGGVTSLIQSTADAASKATTGLAHDLGQLFTAAPTVESDTPTIVQGTGTWNWSMTSNGQTTSGSTTYPTTTSGADDGATGGGS